MIAAAVTEAITSIKQAEDTLGLVRSSDDFSLFQQFQNQLYTVLQILKALQQKF